VLGELVEGSVAAGAEPASPGEFTYRALRHGRLDLARAEAVRDLVAARTLYQARLAFAQADGALSRRLAPLCDDLEEWIVRGEAAVEFVDEAETHLASGDLARAIDTARRGCADLLAGFRSGRVIREGAALAVVGLPNVGKSSLFNRLLERDRAIVTEIAGTTRDTLEESVELDGIPLTLVDTAGLRPAADPVENAGVERAERARREADLVLLVLDGSRGLTAAEREMLRDPGDGNVATVIAVNKCDLPPADASLPHPEALRVSATTGEGVERLRGSLRERLTGSGPLEDPIVTNARHGRALQAALAALDRAAEAGRRGVPEELVLEDLKTARRELGTISGEFDHEDLYDRIFSTFCIGK
jgi:tRNA modification GTPase